MNRVYNSNIAKNEVTIEGTRAIGAMSLHTTTFQTKELCSTSHAVSGFLRMHRSIRRSIPTRVKAGSFDPNSDGETADLTAEFYRIAEPQRKERLQQHLDLMVNVHEVGFTS
jgi:hypothetical protein